MSHRKSTFCPTIFALTLALGWATSSPAQVKQGVTEFSVYAWDVGPTFINNDGTIAVTYAGIETDDNYIGFIRHLDGTFTPALPPGDQSSSIVGISAAGTVTGVGWPPNAFLPAEGFLLDSSGQYSNFNLPTGDVATPTAISSSGIIVGAYFHDYEYPNFIRDASGVMTLFVPPALAGDLLGVNDSGVIIYTYGIRGENGEITSMPESYSLIAINNKGETIGTDNTGFGFIRDRAGRFTKLPNIIPAAINDEGDVCGNYLDNNSWQRSWQVAIRYSDGKIAILGSPDQNLADGGCASINSSRTVVGNTADEEDDYYISEPIAAIDFSTGFSTASDSLNLTGSAAVNGSQLMLTNGKDSEASSAFYGYPVDIRSFTTDFTFVPSDAVADGLTFTIQNDDPSAVGFPGAGLGYQRINKSVALKFDFHNNFGEGPNSTGLYLNGVSPTVPAVDLSQSGINLAGGDPIKVHITYDAATNGGELVLTLTDETSMHTWSKSFTVDIPTTVGATTAYVGFTASTGEKTSDLAISSWKYRAATP